MPDISRSLAAGLLVATLAGCAGLPGHRAEPPILGKLELPATPAGAGAVDAWPADNWWQAYGDPQLDRLMARALADSPNLALATARLDQALAAAGVARGNAAPQVNADLNVSRGRQSARYLIPPPPLGPGGTYVTQAVATVGLGYDLDLWGRNTALIHAAENQAGAAAFDRAGARLALTTALARTYAQLASQYELLDIAEAGVKQRQAIVDLTRQRVAAGLDTSAEVRQAETGTASLEAEKIQLETAIAVTRLQLATLMGAQPAEADRIERPRLQTPPLNRPASLPLDLLGRRPEIAAQGARLAAAREEISAARAQFYPNINLAALIGYQAIGLSNLFSGASLTNSLGPAIRLPIFEGGRLKANYALRQADLEGAIAQYNQSVLAAAQDVVEQLTRAAALDREAEATGAALAAAREAYRLAMLRYREGLAPYLSVLTVETQLLAQQRAMAELKARRLDLHIALVRALGGGFSAQAPATSEGKEQ